MHSAALFKASQTMFLYLEFLMGQKQLIFEKKSLTIWVILLKSGCFENFEPNT